MAGAAGGGVMYPNGAAGYDPRTRAYRWAADIKACNDPAPHGAHIWRAADGAHQCPGVMW